MRGNFTSHYNLILMKKEQDLEQSALTAEDLAISFSKDEEFIEKIKLQYRVKLENDEDTVKVGSRKNVGSKKGEVKLENSSFMSQAGFESFEEIEERAVGEEETTHFSMAREYSENHIPIHRWEKVKKEQEIPQFVEQDVRLAEKEDIFEDVVNDSRSIIGSQTYPILTGEQALRQKLKDLGRKIKKYTVQRNRVKYQLRKDGPVTAQESSEQMRQCPCCKNPISKLCFKCEHTFCNPQNCPRKKKQKLNARMLERMRDKKQGGQGKRRRQKGKSRSRDETREKSKKRAGKADEDSLSDEDSFSEDDLSSDLESSDEETHPLTRNQVKPKEKSKPSWKLTMSDLAFDDSKLFLDSDEDK